MRRSFIGLLITGLGLFGCGDDDSKPADTADAGDTQPEVDAADSAEPDSAEPDATPDVAGDTDEPDAGDTASPDVGDTASYDKPDHFPDKSDADEVLSFDNLSAPVRVVYDDRGIPHIYGANRADVAFVQGFVTARDRIFQMHTLRSAAKGRLAEYAGTGSLSGDIFLRMLKLGRVAEQMAARAADNDPLLSAALDAYTAGVNAYLARMRGGLETKAPEVQLFGNQVYDWSNADTMAIARLQTYDLGFGGVVDELTLWTVLQELRGRHGGTNLEGIELDVSNFEPAAEAATLEPEGGASQVGSFDLGAVLDQPFFSGAARRGWARQIKDGFDAMKDIPHRAFSGGDRDAVPGSNNWVVSGAHTESGRPIVANDTHLSLRNPAIFYHVHTSTKLAGGDLNVVGVQFAGAPGVVLGHNDHAAWGATVFYGDVTDMYVEKLDPTRTKVWFEGAWVDLVERTETFTFVKPDSVATCVDAAPSYVKNLAHSESMDGFRCILEVTLLDVPHHGPIIPWSFRTEGDQELAVSWRWPGFEPTDDLSAVYRLGSVASFDDFKSALQYFGVGAQNWVYGGTDGDIGWYPTHLMPIRKHIAAGHYDYPPFLPMPGDTGETEWDGFLSRDELPQAHNPAKGYLVTANADPIGVSFDNDPFNDGPYIGYAWDLGYRAAQITRRIEALLERSASKITPADMSAVQGDHRSNLGADMVPYIVSTLRLALAAPEPRPKPWTSDSEVLAALDLLEGWAASDYLAHSGVGDDVTADEIKSSAAAAIFNALLPHLINNLMKDEGYVGLDRLGASMMGRFLARLFTRPETMVSFDAATGVHPLWDDVTTPDVVETPAEILGKSLMQTVAFLKDPAKVGPAQNGGFGTADMNEWRWGKLHTVTLRHNITAAFNIPAPEVLPTGFPRGGDNFTVDACNPGFTDTNFTYAHGAAIRNVYELTDAVGYHGVIPGGQSEHPLNPHYSDEAFLWARNEAPEVAFTVDEVLGAKERTVDFLAAP